MITIRKIRKQDNATIAAIIRGCLTEFNADKPGTVYYDESTDHLYELFNTPLSTYFIAESEGKTVGGAGIFPSDGLPQDTCELVKMYILPEARQSGIGATLMNECLVAAKQNGYNKIYLETLPELKRAISVYEKFNFTHLERPLGNTGHHGCTVWMSRVL
jgi:putative acetyltransferase